MLFSETNRHTIMKHHGAKTSRPPNYAPASYGTWKADESIPEYTQCMMIMKPISSKTPNHQPPNQRSGRSNYRRLKLPTPRIYPYKTGFVLVQGSAIAKQN